MKIIIISILALIIVNIAILLAVNIVDSEIENPLNEISGAVKTFEVVHEGQYIPKHLTVVINKRFNDKFFEYLESKQESRRTTFFR